MRKNSALDVNDMRRHRKKKKQMRNESLEKGYKKENTCETRAYGNKMLRAFKSAIEIINGCTYKTCEIEC